MTTAVPETLEQLETDSAVVVESPAPAFAPDNRVRVADDAMDSSGYSTGHDVRGQIGRLDYYDSYSGWYVRPDNGGYGSYVAPQYLTRLSEMELLQEQVAALTTSLASAQQRTTDAMSALDTARTEFAAWKDNLRTVALEAAEENNLCRVFDQVMEQIGLEGRERDVRVRVNFEGHVYVTISAPSAQAARDEIDGYNIAGYVQSANSYDLTIDDWSTDDDDE